MVTVWDLLPTRSRWRPETPASFAMTVPGPERVRLTPTGSVMVGVAPTGAKLGSSVIVESPAGNASIVDFSSAAFATVASAASAGVLTPSIPATSTRLNPPPNSLRDVVDSTAIPRPLWRSVARPFGRPSASAQRW
ncbi:hypothetical protein ACI1US_01907 [Leucobacter sp. BZR 635]